MKLSKIKRLFRRVQLARMRYDRTGLVIGHCLINGKPHIRIRFTKRNGEGLIDRHVPYTDVLAIVRYPSPAEKLFLRRKPKVFKVKINPNEPGR